MHHLLSQPNSIDDASDERRKYMFRHFLAEVLPSFIDAKYENGPFRLICDNLRPGNVLIDPGTLKINAVIDWQWTYTAPYQLSYVPLRWLIPEKICEWDSEFEALYRAKLDIFLHALQDEEEELENDGMREFNVPREQLLSMLMRIAFWDGSFWFGELLRESLNFD